MSTKEIWKTHPKYTNYKISNLGRIWAKDRTIHYQDGRQEHFQGQIMKPHLSKWGYLVIILTYHHKRIHKQVNDLVTETFLPNPCGYPETHHKDYDRTNNNVNNLIWTTHQFKMKDKKEHYWKEQKKNNPDSNVLNNAQRKFPLCGKPMAKRAIICLDCRKNYRRSHINGYKITLDQLMDILYYYKGNFSKVGRLFEVSSNNIARKLKRNNLPYHTRDYR